MNILNSNSKINKSKKIIKKEKQKIKNIKEKNFYNSKIGKIIKNIFLVEENNYNYPSIKKQIKKRNCWSR